MCSMLGFVYSVHLILSPRCMSLSTFLNGTCIAPWPTCSRSPHADSSWLSPMRKVHRKSSTDTSSCLLAPNLKASGGGACNAWEDLEGCRVRSGPEDCS